MSKKGLGRGLQALIPNVKPSQDGNTEENTKTLELSLEEIRPRDDQPRRFFSDDKLDELAQSIREHGIIQPIIVRKSAQGYELIAGERRWRAAQRAGLKLIPAVVKEYNDADINEVALIENLQREDLNPIEEALALRKLGQEFQLTQEQMAQKLGKSRPYVANCLRILNLPSAIQQLVATGELSSGHVRPLLGVKSKERQLELAQLINKKGLSVRQTEELVRGLEKREQDQENKQKIVQPQASAVLPQAEDRLRSKLGTAVRIKAQGSKGKIEIEYYNDEDFNRIMELVLGNLEF
ncbi:MAG: ParB/RepB/Spo0J family partition protein [Carboxydocellales bacterium]